MFQMHRCLEGPKAACSGKNELTVTEQAKVCHQEGSPHGSVEQGVKGGKHRLLLGIQMLDFILQVLPAIGRWQVLQRWVVPMSGSECPELI